MGRVGFLLTRIAMYFVYVLRSKATGRFYVGSSQDVANRFREHNAGETTATKNGRPWELVHTEAFTTRSEAVRREREIKGWKNPRYMIEKLGIHPSDG